MTIYFAYGSNMNRRQMALRCPDADPIGPAILRGWRLTFRCVADIEPHPGGRVYGALWNITHSDRRSLDRYEGYPNHYGIRRVRVEVPGRRWRMPLVYVMVNRDEHTPPSYHYLNSIIEGYHDFGLDHQPVLDARDRIEAEFDELEWGLT